MNFKGFVSGLAGLGFVVSLALGADQPSPPAGHSKTNAVARLRNQDAAFSLVMESYRQMQVGMIDNDHEKLAAKAKLITDPQERDRILSLIATERSERLAKLEVSLTEFESAYTASRKMDERTIGQTVASTSSTTESREKLKQMVTFAPRPMAAEEQTSDILPIGRRVFAAEVPR